MKTLIYLALSLSLLSLDALAQRPVVSGISPASATVNEIVSISGTNLPTGTDAHVQFGAASGTIIEATSSQIKVSVPAGASFDGVTVTNLTTTQSSKSANPFLLAFGGSTFDPTRFTAETAFTSNFGLYDLCACDFNNDGLVDVVTTHQNQTSLSVFQNTSTPPSIISFFRTSLSIAANTRSVMCSDLDGDGRPDLVVSGNGANANRIYVMRNLSTQGGSVVFAPPLALPLSNSGAAMLAIRDLNGDGRPDIVSSNIAISSTGLAFTIFKNASTPGFMQFDAQTQEYSISTITTTHALSVQDLDGDGLADIAVAPYQGSDVHILRNTSSGTTISFATGPTLTTSAGLINLVAADITGDGKPELAATNQFTHSLYVWQNNSSSGNLQFGSAQNIATGESPWGVAAGDLDGNGRPELVVSKTGTSRSLFVVTNTGSTLSLSGHHITTTENGRYPLIVDFSGDGKPDLAYTGTTSNNLRVFRNTHCVEPRILPAGPITLCSGQTIKLQATQALHVTYSWTRNGVAITNTASSLTISESGDYAVKITSTADACTPPASQVVQVIAGTGTGSSVAMEAIAPACIGGSTTLSATAISGATYVWNGPNGFTATTTTPTYTLTNLQTTAAGSYSVVIKSGDCQFTPASKTLTVNTNPQPQVNASATAFCSGTTVTLQASTGFAGYQWKLNGANYTGTGATSDRLVTSTAGTYSVIVTNSAGCKGESATISVAQTQAPVANFTAPGTACLQQAITFNNTSTFASGQTPTYQWSFGDGTTSTQASPSHSYSAVGMYTVNLTVSYGSQSCSSNMSKTITVVATPDVRLLANGSTSFCPGEGVELYLEGDVASVVWSTGATTATILAKESGTYKATVATSAGCSVERTITVTHLSTPGLTISATNKSLKVGESTTLTVGGDALRYEWQEAEGLSDLYSASVIVNPGKTTTYTVKGWSENGCYGTAEITIEVDNSFRIDPPKIFIPASDMAWTVTDVELYPDYSLTIVNSLGRTIYQAKPYANNWDGTEQGNAVAAGVYYYIFKDGAGKVVKTGSITLFR